VRLQALCPGQVGPQADARGRATHIELIGITQERRGEDHGLQAPPAKHDQNEREQGYESCPLRHDGTSIREAAGLV
jgi:hypothetical protein